MTKLQAAGSFDSARDLIRTPSREENDTLNNQEVAERPLCVRSAPPALSYETSAVCNLSCVMCPPKSQRPPARQVIARVAEQVVPLLPTARFLQLHGLGEPLASPLFWRMLQEAQGKGIALFEINTNGLQLNEERADRLIASDLSLINVSLDAATEQTYQRIRGGDFGLLVDNVRQLCARRRRRGSGPRIAVNMTLMVENVVELPALVDLASDLGADAVYTWHLALGTSFGNDAGWKVERDDWTFVYPQQHVSANPALFDRMLRQAGERAKELGIELVSPHQENLDEGIAPAPDPGCSACSTAPAEEPVTCDAPWKWAYIGCDGSLKPCCYANHSVGSLAEQPFFEVWNNSLMQELRSSLCAGSIHPLCRGAACSYVTSLEASDRLQAYDLQCELDHDLWFRSGSDSWRFLLDGWNRPETWGVWSLGEVARMAFRPPQTTCELVLHADVTGFGGHDQTHTEVEVELNGRTVACWQLPRHPLSSRRTLNIPDEVMAHSVPIELTFRIKNPVTPRSVGLADDDRLLGIGIGRIVLSTRRRRLQWPGRQSFSRLRRFLSEWGG